MQGFIFRDPASGGKIVLVDGIIASLFFAFDRYADRAMINATLARTFGFEALKNARSLLYHAFSLQEENGRIPDKRTEDTLLKDLWEKITKIDMKGQGEVVVCMPYNFTIPQFVSDAEYLAETAQDTTNTMVLERMTVLEKRVDDKNNEMMKLLQNINDKVNVSPPLPPPTFAPATYSAAAAQGGMRGTGGGVRNQGRPQHLNIPGGSALPFRDRSPSVKRGISDVLQPNIANQSKRRIMSKNIVSGSRTLDKVRKMKSPPADIFVYGIYKDTTKSDIVEDLAECDIQIAEGDIQLMSKGSPAVVSYKISVKAEDLVKVLDPTVWPLRVKVREFIHYKKRHDMRTTDRIRNTGGETRDYDNARHNVRSVGTGQQSSLSGERRDSRGGNVYNFLENDVPA